jgi:peptidoglycan hydrolase-like protein with peptidoglycan-binding domain
MRDVLDDDAGRISPPAVAAILVAAFLSLAVGYNALLGQDGGHTRLAAASGKGSARVDVVAGQPATGAVTVRYDPEVEAVQRQLKAAGFYDGEIDGVAGKRTRAAIEAYQASAGLDVTGEASQELAEQIRFTMEIARASEFTGTTGAPPAAPEARLIRYVQTSLAELGYEPGEVTGEMSAATESAILAFEKDRQLPETGRISEALIEELSKVSGDTSAPPQ